MKLKKFFFLSAIFVSFFVLMPDSLSAQNKIFSPPKRLLLAGEKAEEKEEGLRLLREYFYPIGWSKDGKFAFYTEPADEACGCYFADIFVIDLRTDKVLWSKKYEGKENATENIQSYWRKSRKEFSNKLNQYKIEANPKFTLAKLPIKHKKDTVKIDFFSDVTFLDDPFSSKGSIVIKLISAQKGTKTVFEKKYTGENYEGVMEAQLGGVLQSPFEPRVAIILVKTMRGWEGPPHITQVSVVGADLEKGFK
jgi:uncharacterized protein YfcZ (UPF0381/DUF406 family)